MMATYFRAGGLGGVVLVAFSACRSATEIDVVVKTDFPCADLRHVDITVGTLGDDLERNRAITTSSATCIDGYVGKLVVVPQGSNSDEVGIKVVAGFGAKFAEDCVSNGASPPSYGPGCIVQRRALRYLPHTTLTLNVTMYASCDGIACNATETCDNGHCIPALITDSSSCQRSGCSDPILDPIDAGGDATVPPEAGADAGNDAGPSTIAATCGDMSGLQAGSPWPMSGFCPTRRGRSPYVGAQTSTVKWTYPVGVSSDVAIAADGTLYFGGFDGKLHAATPSGATKWSFPTSTAEAVLGSPAIAADGTIYFGAQDHNFYALTPAGAQKWVYPCADVASPPNVGGDGTVYFTSKDHMLHAVDPQGKKRWEVALGGSDLYAQPVLSVDGATLYIADFDGSLYAVTSKAGAPLWSFPTSGLAHTPAVGPDGAIYFGSGDKNLYALNADGTKRWAFLTGAEVGSAPALGENGVVYATSNDGKLYAIDSKGGSMWSYPSGRIVTVAPTVDAAGAVYFMAADGASGGIFVVDAQGPPVLACRFRNRRSRRPAAR